MPKVVINEGSNFISFLLQILPAEEYTTSKRNGCVKLRKEESGLGSEEPISVPTLLQDAAAAYPEVIKITITVIEITVIA